MLSGSNFSVADCDGGVLEVEPNPSGPYFQAHRVATARTDITKDDTWAFLGVHPPLSPKPELSLTTKQHVQLDAMRQEPGLRALMQRLSIDVAITEVEGLPGIFGRELPDMFKRYPQGSLWYISVDPVLLGRLAFMRVALQLHLTPDADFGGESRATFFNVHQLSTGATFDEVIKPILLTFAPVVSGFAMNVYPHAFVFLFGQFDDDHDMRNRGTGPIAESFFPSVNAHTTAPGIKVPVEQLPFGHIESLLAWWAARLSVLYGHAADPTRFRLPSGDHDVAAQAAWFFTFERLLADILAMTASVQEPRSAAHARVRLTRWTSSPASSPSPTRAKWPSSGASCDVATRSRESTRPWESFPCRCNLGSGAGRQLRSTGSTRTLLARP